MSGTLDYIMFGEKFTLYTKERIASRTTVVILL